MLTKRDILKDDHRMVYDELCRIDQWRDITPMYRLIYLILKVLNDLLEKEINRVN